MPSKWGKKGALRPVYGPLSLIELGSGVDSAKFRDRERKQALRSRILFSRAYSQKNAQDAGLALDNTTLPTGRLSSQVHNPRCLPRSTFPYKVTAGREGESADDRLVGIRGSVKAGKGKRSLGVLYV